MRRPGRTGTLAVLVASSICFGCTKSEAEQAGSHRFVVPDGYRIPESDWPFFLPRSDDDGFTFVLNPNVAPPQQVLVGIDTKANVCRHAAGSEAYVNTTVCTASPLHWRNGKLHRSGDDIFWDYTLVQPVASSAQSQAVLISCSQVSGPPKGLCMVSLPFRDLVVTLHINDAEVPKLAADYDAATGLLRAWER